VPLKAPQTAAITNAARIFNDLPAAPPNAERQAVQNAGRAGGAAAGGQGRAGAAGAAQAAGERGRRAQRALARLPVAQRVRRVLRRPAQRQPGRTRWWSGRVATAAPPDRPQGPNQCHDITVYPDVGLAGGAVRGPRACCSTSAKRRIQSVWTSSGRPEHVVLALGHVQQRRQARPLLDEWGGGGAPYCQAQHKLEWGADSLFAIENNKMVFKSYYKMPAAQTEFENCVAHNGSNIPIPGREVMVQAFYQGGLTVFDWTDPAKPFEVAFHDRGPLDGTRMMSGGSWSAYWYNGVIVSSEIARGLDIFELLPNPLITQNEIDAAKTVKMDYWNTQEQRRFVWPPVVRQGQGRSSISSSGPRASRPRASPQSARPSTAPRRHPVAPAAQH
jgi:hypothetical protein